MLPIDQDKLDFLRSVPLMSAVVRPSQNRLNGWTPIAEFDGVDRTVICSCVAAGFIEVAIDHADRMQSAKYTTAMRDMIVHGSRVDLLIRLTDFGLVVRDAGFVPDVDRIPLSDLIDAGRAEREFVVRADTLQTRARRKKCPIYNDRGFRLRQVVTGEPYYFNRALIQAEETERTKFSPT